jgi:molybdenum cofactor cytidylyltransferase
VIAASNCAAIVLAAGRSKRFGKTDKLLAHLNGRPMAAHVAHTLSSIGFAQTIAVVSCAEVSALFTVWNFEVMMVERSRPQGYSLLRGAEAVAGVSSALVLLADMPFVTADHVRRLLSAANGDMGSVTCAENYVGPPAILPVRTLLQVDPLRDRGAKTLLASAGKVEADPAQIMDFDYIDDLQQF